MKKLFLSFLVLLFSESAFAQATQFYLEDILDDKSKVKIYVVGDAAAKTQIQEALYRAVDHARETAKKLDAGNAAGELSGINQKKTGGNFMVSEELAKAVAAGIHVAEWTKESGFKNVKVNEKNNEIKIGAKDVTLDLHNILRGFLADLMAGDLTKAGWKNCLIKLGNAFIAKGNDVKGPWKIPIIVPADKLAKRAFYYKATNVGAATLSVADGDKAPSNLKSTTVFANDAAKALGLATAIYGMGEEEGKKFLEKNKGLRAVLVNSEGKITHIPEYKPTP